MAISYHLIKPGMNLWQKTRVKRGNTTTRCDAWYAVKIVEVHAFHCIVHWNGNHERYMRKTDAIKLYRNRPDSK